MKGKTITLCSALAISALGFSSCGTTQSTTSSTDDVYYTPRAESGNAPSNNSSSAPATNPDNHSGSGDYYDENYSSRQGDNNSGNGYNSDDYYDYSYSARIKRFYTPASGYGYYDPYYTNS